MRFRVVKGWTPNPWVWWVLSIAPLAERRDVPVGFANLLNFRGVKVQDEVVHFVVGYTWVLEVPAGTS